MSTEIKTTITPRGHHLQYRQTASGGFNMINPKTSKRYYELRRSLYRFNWPVILSEEAKINKQIASECDPQEVYFCEYNDCECMYSCIGDEDAIKLVADLFGVEIAKSIVRFSDLYNLNLHKQN